MIDRELNFQAALNLYGLGFNVLPVWRGRKNPAVKEWKIRQMERLSRVELRSLFLRRDVDPAIVCGELEETGVNVLGIDFDSKEEFASWQGPDFGQMVRSPGGFHGYAQLEPGLRLTNSVKAGGRPIDIRHHGAYLKAPPGVSDTGAVYEWVKGPVPARELPLFPRELFEEILKEPKEKPTKSVIPATVARHARMRAVKSPAAYVMKIESVQGSHGSKRLVRAVCVLRDAGWPPMQTYEFLVNQWNAQCAKPPWSPAEIQRAVERHYSA